MEPARATSSYSLRHRPKRRRPDPNFTSMEPESVIKSDVDRMMSAPSQTIVKSEYINQNSLVTTQILSTDDVLKPETVDQYTLAPIPTRTVGFNCEFCDQRFHLKDHLIKHVTKSHQLSINVNTEYKSRKSLSTENQSLAAYHQSQSETKHHKPYSPCSARIFQCYVCEKLFKSKSKVKSHQRSRSDERPFPCSLCGKSFKSQNYLKQHHRSHSGEIHFPCNLCGKLFKYKSEVKQHIMRIQSQCNLCEKSFNFQIYLKSQAEIKRHQRSQSDERPFQCNLCGRSFTSQAGARQHQRSHSDERPYQCDLCTKRFKSRNNLADHQRVHNNERPYQW
eukprot:70730_1